MANPLREAVGNGAVHVKMKRQSPHAKSLTGPSHKDKVAKERSPAVPMPKGGVRASAAGRDTKMGNTFPGKELSGVVRAVKGPARFGDQGMRRV